MRIVILSQLVNDSFYFADTEIFTAAIQMEAAGADRFAIQDALMPYQDLLPKRLKGKNERVDEPLKD